MRLMKEDRRYIIFGMDEFEEAYRKANGLEDANLKCTEKLGGSIAVEITLPLDDVIDILGIKLEEGELPSYERGMIVLVKYFVDPKANSPKNKINKSE